MGRQKIFTEVPPYLQDQSPEVQALSIKSHAINVLTDNYVFAQLEALAYLRDTSVSGLVRLAIAKTFEELEEQDPELFEFVQDEAAQLLDHAVERDKRLAQVRQQLS